VNRLVIQASVLEMGAPRYTPAGVPVADLLLEHQSQQQESGQERTVKLQLKAIGFGSVAERLKSLTFGVSVEFQGFLTQARVGKGVVLHIQDFKLI
jgi:primosomal replication protein N